MKHLAKTLLISFVFCMVLCMAAPVYAGSLRMSQKKVYLVPKQTVRLSVRGTKKKARWISSNKKIVTVSSKGKVKARKAGKATIYAVVKGKKVKCKVVVESGLRFSYGGHKYTIVNRGMKWTKADAICKAMGGHLVTITSEAEQNAIVTRLKAMGSNQRNNYWIGGFRNSSGTISWVTGEDFNQYTNWDHGQPDHAYYSGHGYEECVMMYTSRNWFVSSSAWYKWNDLVNDAVWYDGAAAFGKKNFGYICEWDGTGSGTAASTTSVTAASHKVTLSSWNGYDNASYEEKGVKYSLLTKTGTKTGTYKTGETVSITMTDKYNMGYVLYLNNDSKQKIEGVGSKTVTFTMPDADVYVSVNYYSG